MLVAAALLVGCTRVEQLPDGTRRVLPSPTPGADWIVSCPGSAPLRVHSDGDRLRLEDGRAIMVPPGMCVWIEARP